MKPTPLTLREHSSFNTTDTAYAAGVSPDVVYFMLVGRPVSRGDAEKVLAALSRLLGQDLNLETVAVVLEAEDDAHGAC